MTEDERPEWVERRKKAMGIFGIGKDVELDDGHTYVANFITMFSSVSDQKILSNPMPITGDDILICKLTAADGSDHFALRFKGRAYKAEIVK